MHTRFPSCRSLGTVQHLNCAYFNSPQHWALWRAPPCMNEQTNKHRVCPAHKGAPLEQLMIKLHCITVMQYPRISASFTSNVEGKVRWVSADTVERTYLNLILRCCFKRSSCTNNRLQTDLGRQLVFQCQPRYLQSWVISLDSDIRCTCTTCSFHSMCLSTVRCHVANPNKASLETLKTPNSIHSDSNIYHLLHVKQSPAWHLHRECHYHQFPFEINYIKKVEIISKVQNDWSRQCSWRLEHRKTAEYCSLKSNFGFCAVIWGKTLSDSHTQQQKDQFISTRKQISRGRCGDVNAVNSLHFFTMEHLLEL